jgi:ribosomal protein S6
LERNLKLTDGILRYLTVRTEESAITNPNPAAVRAHTEQARHVTEESSAKAEPTT